MQILRVYKCLGDVMRLRILNLLQDGPLCVCHLMEILDCDQVRMSKQLRYMKELGVLASERQAQWMIYRILDKVRPVVLENLVYLREHGDAEFCLAGDLKKRHEVMSHCCSRPADLG